MKTQLDMGFWHLSELMPRAPRASSPHPLVGRGDDTVGNPQRAQISQFELFELKFLNSSFSSLCSC